MTVDVVQVLVSGLIVAALCVPYGLIVGVFCAPLLVAKRLRRMFDTIPNVDWRVTYALFVPLPAVVWGFLFGSVLELSSDLRPPTRASPLYLGGVDGIAVATLVSLLLWPTLLLYVLPRTGVDWDPNDYAPTTVFLVVAGLVWYLLFLVGPAYALSVFAGFGDAMAGA
jgi:hypothetical protein